jgi:hypothetical protein
MDWFHFQSSHDTGLLSEVGSGIFTELDRMFTKEVNMKSPLTLFLAGSLIAAPSVSAYTSAAAEDAFFWHYWRKVFLQPSPLPPGESEETDADFGVFFGNTSQWESFFAIGGVGNWVWGADWFTDKQMDPHFTPFSDEYESTTAARWILGYVSKNTFGLPWNFQVGSYLRLVSSPEFKGIDMYRNPNLVPYAQEDALRLSAGAFIQSKVDAKKFVSNFQWVPGEGGLTQPTFGLLDMSVRAYRTLIGPEAVWRTADSSSALQLGFNLRREDFGIEYSIKATNAYRQNVRKLDYSAWSDALTDGDLWSGVIDVTSPNLFGDKDEMHQKVFAGAWYGKEDGAGWQFGLSHYFSRTLHMDLSLAFNDWSQDPVVGRTESYKLLLSYYN